MTRGDRDCRALPGSPSTNFVETFSGTDFWGETMTARTDPGVRPLARRAAERLPDKVCCPAPGTHGVACAQQSPATSHNVDNGWMEQFLQNLRRALGAWNV